MVLSTELNFCDAMTLALSERANAKFNLRQYVTIVTKVFHNFA